MKITFDERVKRASDFMALMPSECLYISQSIWLAKWLDIKTAGSLRNTLSKIEKAGGPKVVLPYQKLSKAMKGQTVSDTRAVDKNGDKREGLPDCEVPPPPPPLYKKLKRGESTVKWNCGKNCRFWYGCKAAHFTSVLPCEGTWYEFEQDYIFEV